MEPRKPSRDASAPPASVPTQLERLLDAMAAALPAIDRRVFNDALDEARKHPRATLRILFKALAGKEVARKGIAERLLVAIGGSDVRDYLNGLIVDAEAEGLTRTLASEMLAELGSPVDPDILAMSVPEAGKLRAKLPGHALEFLGSGDLDGALKHAKALAPAERWLIIHRAASERKEAALPFLATLARETEEDAVAAVSAISNEKLAAGVPLLLELQRSADKEMQKLVKKALFDLRNAGVAVPDEGRPTAVSAEKVASPDQAAPEGSDEELPLYRALISEASPDGLFIVTIARVRANGRLKVFSVLVNPWKRGIQEAVTRMAMSKSSFDRFIEAEEADRVRMKSATLEECRRMVARGVRVARELGTPLPFDFGAGRSLLGDIEAEIAEIAGPFLCINCGELMDAATVERIRATAAYDNIPAETRCVKCRKA